MPRESWQDPPTFEITIEHGGALAIWPFWMWCWEVTLSGYKEDGNPVWGYRSGVARTEDTARMKTVHARKELEAMHNIRITA